MTASWEMYLTVYALFFTLFGIGLKHCYDLGKEYYQERWGDGSSG